MKFIVELSDSKIREILVRHIQETYSSKCDYIDFRVEQGYNGEMGGEPTPSKVTAFWERVSP